MDIPQIKNKDNFKSIFISSIYYLSILNQFIFQFLDLYKIYTIILLKMRGSNLPISRIRNIARNNIKPEVNISPCF